MADILLCGLILLSKKSSRAAQHAADALGRRGQDRPRVVLCEGARDWVSLLVGARSAVGGVELELPECHRCGGVAMRYAVDTNVVSELMRSHPDSAIEGLMVASIALHNDAMLATRNTLDFDYLDTPLRTPSNGMPTRREAQPRLRARRLLVLLDKEEGGLYLQGVGYFLYVLKAHVYAELLDASDIGAMQPAPLCQLFLGEVCLTAVVPHIGRERLEKAHKTA